MKKLLFLIFLLPLLANAQKGFPVQNAKDKLYILANEGDVVTGGGDDTHVGTHAAVTAFSTTPIYTYQYFTKPGLFTNMRKLEVSSDGPVKIRINYNRVVGQPSALDRLSNTPGFTKVFGSGGGSVILEDLDIYESANITVNCYATTTTDPNIAVAVDGIQVTSDFNWDARNVMLEITDSRGYSAGGLIGGTGSIANPGISNCHQRIAQTLRAENKSFRLVSKGVSGETTLGTRRRLESGDLNALIRSAKLIVYNLGVNDAAAGTAVAQNFDVNTQWNLDYIFSVNPTVSLIYESPYGSDVPNVVTNLPGYRTIIAGYAALSKYSSKNFIVVDQFTAIGTPSGTDANFTETTTNTRLHARWDTGHVLLYNQLMPVVRTTNAYTGN